MALPYKKKAYFDVDGPHDTFDNIRMTLWMNRRERRSVVTGAAWRTSWTTAPGGIIPKQYESNGFGHAFKIFGQKKIGNEMYLVAQLSNGTEIGDKGIFYFPREVVNREFVYNSYTYKDIPRELAEYYQQTKTSPKASFIDRIKALWRQLLDLMYA